MASIVPNAWRLTSKTVLATEHSAAKKARKKKKKKKKNVHHCFLHAAKIDKRSKTWGTYAGAALHDARRSKERTYPELLNNRRCRLVVLGIEVGGRWSNEASNFICMLAKARARSSPPSLQAATSAALVSRWSALLTHAAATAFAASLLFEDLSPHHNHDGDLLPLGHLLSHTSPPVPVSRLPAR